MKEKHTFKGKIHSDFGTAGFVPDFNPMFEPFTGIGVAHDVLEHHWKDDTGGMQFELMATGASLFIRDDVYRNQRGAFNTNPADSWQGIFVEMFRYFEGEYGDSVPSFAKYVPYKGYTRKLDEVVEAQIEQIFHKGLKRDFLKEEHIIHEDTNAHTLELIQQLKKTGRHWVRKGYRDIQKRFKDCKSWELGQTFWNIETSVERILKQYEPHDINGGELIVTLDTKDPECTVKVEFKSAFELEEELYSYDNEENEY